MPTFEHSQKIREWINKAIAAGMKTPAQIEQWIYERSEDTFPTIATISRIMREEMGYTKEGWKKGK
jgi:hypothetical protein